MGSRDAYSSAVDNLELVFNSKVENDLDNLVYQNEIELKRKINRIKLDAASELESILDDIRRNSPAKKITMSIYLESDQQHTFHVQDEEQIEETSKTTKRNREWVSLDEDEGC